MPAELHDDDFQSPLLKPRSASRPGSDPRFNDKEVHVHTKIDALDHNLLVEADAVHVVEAEETIRVSNERDQGLLYLDNVQGLFFLNVYGHILKIHRGSKQNE